MIARYHLLKSLSLLLYHYLLAVAVAVAEVGVGAEAGRVGRARAAERRVLRDHVVEAQLAAGGEGAEGGGDACRAGCVGG